MADDIDKANDLAEMERVESIRAIMARPSMAYCGRCRWCDEPIEQGAYCKSCGYKTKPSPSQSDGCREWDDAKR